MPFLFKCSKVLSLLLLVGGISHAQEPIQSDYYHMVLMKPDDVRNFSASYKLENGRYFIALQFTSLLPCPSGIAPLVSYNWGEKTVSVSLLAIVDDQSPTVDCNVPASQGEQVALKVHAGSPGTYNKVSVFTSGQSQPISVKVRPENTALPEKGVPGAL